jgi:predicted outer membrane lipoprotein
MQKDKLPAKNLPVACAVEIIIGFAMEHAGDTCRRYYKAYVTICGSI